MVRRIGWLALAAFAALSGAGSLLAAAWQLGNGIADRDHGAVVGAIGFGAIFVAFWRWIALGAWERAHPAVDPGTGVALAPHEEIGPWGWVGRGLIAAILLGFVALTWLARDAGEGTEQADRVRERAELEARRTEITVDRVQAAQDAHGPWSVASSQPGADPGPSPYDRLLTVPGGRVADVSVRDGTAAILITVAGDDGAPCVVIDVDEHDRISSRTTQQCAGPAND